MPSARICLALVEITIVADAGTLFAFCDMDKIAQPPLSFNFILILRFNDTFLAQFCQIFF
jgi:hypothetical protein